MLQVTSPEFDSLLREILAKGNSIRCRAEGRSMFPFIRDGDVLLIEPRSAAETRIGDIIFYRDIRGVYVTHRLIQKTGPALLTKGDALAYYDEPIEAEQVIGRVVQIEGRGKRVRPGEGTGRALGWVIALFARRRGSTRARIKRNLGRLYWLVGGRQLL